MKKIVYTIDNLMPGGAQVHLLRLANGLCGSAYSVEIICLGKTDGAIIDNAGEVPIHIIQMDCVWKPYFWKNFIKLIHTLRKIRPDIVHTYLNTSNVFGYLAARMAGVSMLIGSRRDMGHFRSGIIGSLEKLTGRLSDKVICVTEAVGERSIRKENISPGKTAVIYNGVDVAVFNEQKRDKQKGILNIAMVAAMDRKIKGHSYFMEAAEEVIKKTKDIRFVLIGDGHLRHALEALVASKGLSLYFDFRGNRSDLYNELKDIDILVVPSESEGCSNALLEAMAMGIPAIATAVEGNLEVIEDGKSGFLVMPKDSHAIAEKILEVVGGRGQVGEGARKRILEKFTLDKMVNNYIKLYEELSSSMKVGYVVSLFPCWSETFILNEILSLRKKGIDVTIFSIRPPSESFIQDAAKPLLVDTRYVKTGGLIKSAFTWLLRKPFTVSSLFLMVMSKRHKNYHELFKNIGCVFVSLYFAEIAKKEKLTHVHAHFATYPALVAMCMSKLTKIPFTFTAHAHDIFLDKALLKEKAKAANAIVAISEYNKQYIDDYCKNGAGSKIRVIHCGVDLFDYSPAAKRGNGSDRTIVSIGRMVRMKGFEYLIKACGKVKSETSFRCYIIGDGPLKAELANLIDKEGLSDRIILTGTLDNSKVRDILGRATLCVLPCVWDDVDGQDGIPLALIEAMALGIPTISSRISGIPELIEDGKTGWLTDPKDSVKLSEKMMQLIENDELRTRFSTAGRSKVESDFNITKTTDSLIGLFKEIQCEQKKTG